MNKHKAAEPILEVGEANFEAEVLKCTKPVLVAFVAPWSRPCQVIDPVLDDVALACAGRARVVRVNADNAPDLGIAYEIQSIPSLLFFVAGELRGRVVGTASKEAILEKLAKIL